jgi:predicted metalloprotease with PDZ domain
MIVMGHYEYSRATVGNSKVVFAIVGDYSHQIIKEEFCKVLQSQQEIAGDLPSHRLLVSFLPTSMDSCKGTSLSNALNVNIPLKEKLSPFNFAVIGTTSHELFHQWNVRYVRPKSEEGIYLLTEGFTNYFAIAALARAGLISEERFGRFLCRYRKFLSENPKYPGSDYATIQGGLTKDEHLFDLCYTKGPFVAVLLDLALREDTSNKESVASWFRVLCEKFGGTGGYEIADLRELVITVSGKQNGQAVKTFDSAFLGGQALDLDELFNKLGITCDSEGNCRLIEISKDAANTRSQVFKAEN